MPFAYLFSECLQGQQCNAPSALFNVAQELYEYYDSTDPYVVYPDFVEFAKHQKAKMIVISNYDKRLPSLLERLDLAQFFEAVVTSEAAQSSKPHRDIFQWTLDKCGLPDLEPNQVLHIGDDVSKDYLGARDMGWHALLIRRDQQELTHDVPLHHVCKSFHDVPEDLVQEDRR